MSAINKTPQEGAQHSINALHTALMGLASDLDALEKMALATLDGHPHAASNLLEQCYDMKARVHDALMVIQQLSDQFKT
ncbi:MAG: hypothetical protein H0W44_00835 [Gammaproteobacteria bacterium]|nr:hypothetical protein [Gammaproteobacteria bacterium]